MSLNRMATNLLDSEFKENVEKQKNRGSRVE